MPTGREKFRIACMGVSPVGGFALMQLLRSNGNGVLEANALGFGGGCALGLLALVGQWIFLKRRSGKNVARSV